MAVLSKKQMSEEDIKLNFITPAIQPGWQGHITMETKITDGRINIKGNIVARSKPKFADYMLYLNDGKPIAVVEAKDNNHTVSHGLPQAMTYAQMMDLPQTKMILIGWEHSNDERFQGISNIEVLPNISDANVLAEYYSLADVFVLTSLAENYATVNLEAMACGTPVVGFDCGGTPEQLTGGKGIAVPTGNQQALNQAVRQVLDGEITLLRGEELSQRIRTENSLEKMTQEYRKLYEDII